MAEDEAGTQTPEEPPSSSSTRVTSSHPTVPHARLEAFSRNPLLLLVLGFLLTGVVGTLLTRFFAEEESALQEQSSL
ncbi:MAG: hypothetical protein MN733_25160 [Nitrososphaera sp.]|nr:hypothetical protein [Nitrososphaera sp.]